MIETRLHSLPRQMLLVVTSSVLAFGLCFFSNYQPRLGLSPAKGLLGITYGLGIMLLLTGVIRTFAAWRHYSLERFVPEYFAHEKLTSLPRTALALSRATAEELLRICFLGVLQQYSWWLAYSVNLVISAAFHWQRRSNLPWLLLKCFEGTIYAAIYVETNSYFAIFFVHLLNELFLPSALLVPNTFGRKLLRKIVPKFVTSTNR